MALTNSLLLLLVIGWGPTVKQAVLGAPSSLISPTVSPQPTARVEQPTGPTKRRIVRVFVTATPKATQAFSGLSPTSDPSGGVPPAQSGNSASAPTSAPPAQPTPDARCLIKIDGSVYDVTAFRTAHSGGNVFTCGADMSQIFWSRHGQSMLDYMSRYKV